MILRWRVPRPSFFEGRGFCLDYHGQDQPIGSMRTKPLSHFIFEYLVNSNAEDSRTISLTLRATFV